MMATSGFHAPDAKPSLGVAISMSQDMQLERVK